MKVALVHFIPEPTRKNYLAFNHGLASISAIVKKDGHQARLFCISTTDKAFSTDLSDFAPDAIFIYLATNQYGRFINFLESSKEGLVPVIVGGPHANALPGETAALEGVTAVCAGDGEYAAKKILVGLSRGEPLRDIDNVWTNAEGEIVPPGTSSRVLDLDSLPFADRSIFPYERLINTREMNILGFEFFFARGCNYRCTFCINSKQARFNDGCGRIRRPSVPRVLDEIESVLGNYKYRGIIGFQDDIFTSDLDWIEAFADAYRKRVGLPFWCNAHVNQLDEKRVRALRRAGCVRVQVGVECGDETLRRKVLGKKIGNRDVRGAFERLKQHHIKTVAYFMVGLPDETEQQIRSSIELCSDLRPDWTLVSTFCPYPGTLIYDELVAAGRLDSGFYKNLKMDSYYCPTISFEQRGISLEKLAHYYEHFVSYASGDRQMRQTPMG